MPTIDFPTSPSLNQTYSFGGKTWVWNGYAWDLQASGAINATPIGNVSPSTGAFTTLTATDGNIAINQVQGNAVYAASGLLATGNVDNYSYNVASGAAVFSPNNYNIFPGTSVSLGTGATQQIASQLPSFVAGAGITITPDTNRITVSANVASIPITNVDNTAGNITIFPTFANSSSGNLTSIVTANTQVTYNPLTQTLNLVNANAASLNLSTPLPVESGGTGLRSLGTNSLLLGNGANVNLVFPGPPGSLLTSNGVSWLSSVTTTESVTVLPLAAGGTINYSVLAQPILYYTANATSNCTINFTASGSQSMNSWLQNGQAVTVVFLLTNGATAFLPTTLQIDGSNITPRYQGGSAWTAGNANSIDSYSFTIVKTRDATYTMLASQTRFA